MEFVYAISRDDLFDLRYPQGFHACSGDNKDQITGFRQRAREEGYYIQRSKAEEESSLKQIIPYLLINRDGRILEVERLEKQSEERLHSLFSIGLGGHLNPVDAEEDERSIVEGGIDRELREELQFDGSYEHQFAGIVNDDSNDVGSVHFGLTYRIDFGDTPVDIRETEHMRGRFRTPDELIQRRNDMPEQFESWSRMIIDDLHTVMEI